MIVVNDGSSDNRTTYAYGLSKRKWLFNCFAEEINKVMLFVGIEITKNGILIEAVKAQSLDEVDRRVNSLKSQIKIKSVESINGKVKNNN